MSIFSMIGSVAKNVGTAAKTVGSAAMKADKATGGIVSARVKSRLESKGMSFQDKEKKKTSGSDLQMDNGFYGHYSVPNKKQDTSGWSKL